MVEGASCIFFCFLISLCCKICKTFAIRLQEKVTKTKTNKRGEITTSAFIHASISFFFLGNGTGQSGWGGPTLKKQKIEQVVDRFALSSCVVVSVSPPKGVRDHPLPPRKKDEKKTPQSGPFSLCFFFFFCLCRGLGQGNGRNPEPVGSPFPRFLVLRALSADWGTLLNPDIGPLTPHVLMRRGIPRRGRSVLLLLLPSPAGGE